MEQDQLRQLVELCWRDGHLYGARPGTASKTLTVRGKRRIRIRLQSDICAAIMGVGDSITPNYPDLWLDISDDVAELREAAA
jgi:hypothetical protein